MSSLPSHLPSTLKAYTASPNILKIIHSIPSSPSHLTLPISALLILDSSFNPPTRAHAYLITQAITRLRNLHQHQYQQRQQDAQPPKGRILLLLSTQNADKPSAPASTAQRLDMMVHFAQDLWNRATTAPTPTPPSTTTVTSNNAGPDGEWISGIDIALSNQPRFLEKSVFLADSAPENPYHAALEAAGVVPQWLILGFDTLVRLLDGKYYQDRELGVLEPLFKGGNAVLVVRRGEDGEVQEQERYVQLLKKGKEDGGFDGKGWRTEWGEKVVLVDAFPGIGDDEGGKVSVSSTAVRAAAKEGNEKLVGKMCAEMVAEYVLSNDLYKEG